MERMELGIGIPWDPAIPLLVIYLKEGIQTYLHALLPMTFIMGKALKCPSVDVWIHKMHIQISELLFSLKRKKILTHATL